MALPGKAGKPMSGQAISGWRYRDKPPTNFELHEPLASVLGVGEGWLIKGTGTPPTPELWNVWVAWEATRRDSDRAKQSRPIRVIRDLEAVGKGAQKTKRRAK